MRCGFQGFNLLSRASALHNMAILQLLNQQGLTILLVTHEPDIAEYTSRRVTFRDGRLIRDEPVQSPRDALAEWAALAAAIPDITVQAGTERKTADVQH